MQIDRRFRCRQQFDGAANPVVGTVHPVHPAPGGTGERQGPCRIPGLQSGREHAIGYTVPNLLVEHSMRNPHVPPGFWRGVNINHNAIYLECFMDELAHSVGQDPVEFRRKLMTRHPKHLAVLNAVADKIGWGKPAAQGIYRGIAQHMAMPVTSLLRRKISVTDGNKIKVHRIVAATDPGYVVNPAQIERQVAGSFVYGLSGLFYGGGAPSRTAASNKPTSIPTIRCGSARCRRWKRSSCRAVVSGAASASRRSARRARRAQRLLRGDR